MMKALNAFWIAPLILHDSSGSALWAGDGAGQKMIQHFLMKIGGSFYLPN